MSDSRNSTTMTDLMLRSRVRGGSTNTDAITRGIRRLKLSPMGFRPATKNSTNNTVFDESISHLNEMADRISNMGLNETPEPTVDSQPSVSEEMPEEKETPMISTLLLMTNDDDRPVSIRAVLDLSSRCHFLTERCRRRLRLPLVKTETAVGGLGEKILGKTVVNFSLYFNNTRVFQVDAFVTDRIHARTPGVKPSPGEELDLLSNGQPNFYLPSSVDLLIGTQSFPLLMANEPGYFIDENRSAMQSSLGWVMVGRVPADESEPEIVEKPESHEKPAEYKGKRGKNKKKRSKKKGKPAESEGKPAENHDKLSEIRRQREQSFCNQFSPDHFESM